MFFPLKVGSIIDCGSKKSLPQPTFGQTFTFAFGTWQNFEYMTSCGTWRYRTLKPRLFSVSRNASPVFEAGGWSSPTIRISGPLYLPLGKPAAFMYFFATAGSPFGFL